MQTGRGGAAEMRHLVVLLFALIYCGAAHAGEGVWGPWSSPSAPSAVGAGFLHDDGGALIILCDTPSKIISYILKEPRAHWQEGAQIKMTTRADNGAETTSTAHVLNSTSLTVIKDLRGIFPLWGEQQASSLWATAFMPACFLPQTSERQWSRCFAHAAIIGRAACRTWMKAEKSAQRSKRVLQSLTGVGGPHLFFGKGQIHAEEAPPPLTSACERTFRRVIAPSVKATGARPLRA